MNISIRLIFSLLGAASIFVSTFAQEIQTIESVSTKVEKQLTTLLDNPELIRSSVYLNKNGRDIAVSYLYTDRSGKQIFLLVSLNKDDYPVLIRARNNDLESKWEAESMAKAKSKLVNPKLINRFYLGPDDIWFEFSDGKQTLFINHRPVNDIMTTNEFENHKLIIEEFYNSNLILENESKSGSYWQKLENGLLINPESEHVIPFAAAVPDFDWHFGCTPTAAADMLAFYNDYYGYSNLVKFYYREEDNLEGDIDNTVSDLQEVLADHLNTNANGGTPFGQERGRMISDAAEAQDANYDWNDYGYRLSQPWEKMEDEINAGYPCVLSVDLPGLDGGHSFCVMGYNNDTDEFYCYDTWTRGAYWRSRTGHIMKSLAWIHPPQEQSGRKIFLTKFKGECYTGSLINETMVTNSANEITWYCDEYNFGTVSIYINTQSGLGGSGNWTVIADKIDNEGSFNWQPGSNYIGSNNRIRIKWWDAGNILIGSDGSCTDFDIAEGGVTMLNDRQSVLEEWPTTLYCNSTTTQWAVVAVKSQQVTNTNYLRFYSTTDFGTPNATDTVGNSEGGSWGVCLVNVGGADGPTGPYGVKIGGDGEGRVQYKESEELDWGQQNTNENWLKNWDLVKAYNIYIEESEMDKVDKAYIHLENFSDGDYLLTLFDTHKRFQGYADALITVDDNGSGEDEQLHLSNVEFSGNRLLLLAWQKGSILYEGEIRVSLLHERMFDFNIFDVNSSDTTNYSNIVAPLPLGNHEWVSIGIRPTDNSQWEVDSFFDIYSELEVETSNLGYPFTNMLIVNNPSFPGENSTTDDTVYIRLRRISRSGSVYYAVNGIGDQSPLHDGINTQRIWPAGRRFHMLKFESSVPLKHLYIIAESLAGEKIGAGLVPKGDRKIYPTALFWGMPEGVPEEAPDYKEGVAIMWLQDLPVQSFGYTVRTELVTTANEEDLPTEFSLSQNYPNPFNPTTTIKFALTPSLSQWERVSEGRVRVLLKVYDILGNEVETLVNETKSPGSYQVEFDAGRLTSGVYFYKLIVGKYEATRKMILIR